MICIGIASSVASHGLQSFLPGKVLYEGDPVIPGTTTSRRCNVKSLGSAMSESLEKAKPTGQSIQGFVKKNLLV